MKHDIHEISNELYNQRQNKEIEKQRKENTKRLKINSLLVLKEEIENYILDLNLTNISDIQLNVLDNEDIILDNASDRIAKQSYCGDSKDQVRQYLRDKFLTQFNIFFKEYKTRYKLNKEIDKQHKQNVYNDIIDKLIMDFDNLNNQQRYDMKIVLNNMYSEEYINEVFDYLDLEDTPSYREIYYKALSEVRRRKKNTIKEVIVKQTKIPWSWKCYGLLKMIDKLIK